MISYLFFHLKAGGGFALRAPFSLWKAESLGMWRSFPVYSCCRNVSLEYSLSPVYEVSVALQWPPKNCGLRFWEAPAKQGIWSSHPASLRTWGRCFTCSLSLSSSVRSQQLFWVTPLLVRQELGGSWLCLPSLLPLTLRFLGEWAGGVFGNVLLCPDCRCWAQMWWQQSCPLG